VAQPKFSLRRVGTAKNSARTRSCDRPIRCAGDIPVEARGSCARMHHRNTLCLDWTILPHLRQRTAFDAKVVRINGERFRIDLAGVKCRLWTCSRWSHATGCLLQFCNNITAYGTSLRWRGRSPSQGYGLCLGYRLRQLWHALLWHMNRLQHARPQQFAYKTTRAPFRRPPLISCEDVIGPVPPCRRRCPTCDNHLHRHPHHNCRNGACLRSSSYLI